MKYKKDFIKHFGNFPLFSFNDAYLFLSKMGSSKDYIRKLISLMLKREEIYRITKGYYTLNKDPEVIGYAFKPFYYGLGYALNHYNLSEQQANVTIVTTKKVRVGVRNIFGTNTMVRKIPKELYFGYRTVKGENFYFPVSDIEKTLLDMLYFDYVTEAYVYVNLFKKLNRQRINIYLKRYNNRVKVKYNMIKQAIDKKTIENKQWG